MSIQFLLALQLVSDIVLFVAVIFLLAIVGRNSWRKNLAPPGVPGIVDRQAVAELERLISESQAAAAGLIKAMGESRRALKEAVCEVDEMQSRSFQTSGAAKRGSHLLVPAALQAGGGVLQDIPVQDGASLDGGENHGGQEKPSGNGGRESGGGQGGRSRDYQAVLEMACKGMSEKDILAESELTEAEVSLLLELGRKKSEFN